MHEPIVHIGVYVDALHSTAALARVKDGSVDQLRRDVLKVSIRTDVRRVVAAQFKIEGDSTARRGLADSVTAGRGTGEADKSKLGELHELLQDGWVAGVNEGEDVLWKASFGEDFNDALADEGGLRRGLEDDAVAGEEGGDQGVNDDEVGKPGAGQLH